MTPRHLLEPSRLAGGTLLRTQSDSRLVDMTRAGNDRAFEAIVGRYKGVLLRYCSRILPDGRAEDAVQQVFVNAYRALHGDTTPLVLRSWLFGIAHNVSLNVLRQRGLDHEPLEDHPGAEESTHVTLERRERVREVLAAVVALPPSQRDAIVLRELEGRSHEEIARELGVTGGAARQLISRARSGIRRAAAAVVPMPLLMRLTADTAQGASAERIAELTTVGGGVTVTKVVATGAIGATLLGGAVTGPDLVEGDKDHGGADVAEAAPSGGDDVKASDAAGGDTGAVRRDDAGTARSSPVESGPDEPGDDRDEDSSGPGDGEQDDDSSGPGPSGGGEGDDDDDDDNSGPGSDDDPETDHSGPGGDDDPIDDDAGSDDDTEPDSDDILEPDDDTSGSGTSGSGSSGGDSGPG